MLHTKISIFLASLTIVLFHSSMVLGQNINSQTELNTQIDTKSINDKPIVDTYTNKTGSQSKPIFTYNNGKTEISESKEYGHFERDINLKGAIGSYKLSKPLNGAISDEKSKRISSIRIIKF